MDLLLHKAISAPSFGRYFLSLRQCSLSSRFFLPRWFRSPNAINMPLLMPSARAPNFTICLLNLWNKEVLSIFMQMHYTLFEKKTSWNVILQPNIRLILSIYRNFKRIFTKTFILRIQSSELFNNVFDNFVFFSLSLTTTPAALNDVSSQKEKREKNTLLGHEIWLFGTKNYKKSFGMEVGLWTFENAAVPIFCFAQLERSALEINSWHGYD